MRSRAAGDGVLAPGLRVTVHFQPDLPVGGTDVITALARDGAYRSQFETGVSNGGLTAFRGGDRWGWESRIFDRFYDDRHPADRPKYGSLNHLGDGYGGSPRFGSAYLRLAGQVTARTTFCVPDSVFEPEHFATADRFALLDVLERQPVDDLLDRYVEAHVHGPIDLRRDVEAVVLDPSYRRTAVEAAARRLGCAVEWHAGFRVALDVVRAHPGYRGPHIVDVAEQVAGEGPLTPRVIGAARSGGQFDPQDLKRVWHCLARFGRDGGAG